MQLEEEHLQQITIDVCQSMLGMELNPISPDIDTTNQLVAAVEIHGTRHSIVEIFAHINLMPSLAEVMFASNPGSLSEAEIRDAFCEIANMIGGNVKGWYGEESNLSRPSFDRADDWRNHLPQGSLYTTFECCGYPLSVVLRDLICHSESTKQIAVA